MWDSQSGPQWFFLKSFLENKKDRGKGPQNEEGRKVKKKKKKPSRNILDFLFSCPETPRVRWRCKVNSNPDWCSEEDTYFSLNLLTSWDVRGLTLFLRNSAEISIGAQKKRRLSLGRWNAELGSEGLGVGFISSHRRMLRKVLRQSKTAFPPNTCPTNYQARNSNTPVATIFYTSCLYITF